jgi:eukaryotic-like serine/threonine-protein kinase
MLLPAGTRLGPYEIVSQLGAGGMGEVYRARDSKLGRSVAIKVLPSQVAKDSEVLDRFRREARVLASLNHPNIASIYGFEDSDKPGLVMELVEGPTLADRLRGGPMPVDEGLSIAKQICEALEYAHERGIIHRDVKPANIKVTTDGTVKLLDFGLAKALEGPIASSNILSSPTLSNLATQAGVILGTAAYMPPEQARGRPVDRRADIWGFGCVLFEMFAGRMAFSGESVTDTLAEIIKAEPDWNQLPASTPKPVRALLQRCLKKDPKQRLQAIGEARIVIEELLAGQDQAGKDQADASQTVSAAVSGKQRRPAAWAIGGFLAGAILASVASWWAERHASVPAEMHFSPVTSFAGVQAQPALSPDGRSVAFISNRDGSYNVYVGLVRGGELVQVTHGVNMKSRPSWSPDGSTLAYGQMNDSGTMDVWQVSALGGSPRLILQDANDPTWTTDGYSLLYASTVDGAIWTSGVSGENPRLLVPMDSGRFATEIRPSPDGRMVALVIRYPGGGPVGELGVADLNTSKVRALTRDESLALSPAWSPDSRSLYFASSRGGTLNIWKIGADGEGLRQITAGEGDDAELDVSSDGKRLVFATLRLSIGLAQLDLQAKPGDGGITVLAADSARDEFGPSYSPDGTHIAFFSNLKGVADEAISVADANGANAVQLVKDSRGNLFPQWSPDGSRIVYFSTLSPALAEGEFRSVAASGGPPQTLLHGAFNTLFDVGKDGRLLYQTATGEAQAYDPRDGKNLVLGSLPANAFHLLWSPDGRSVAYLRGARRKDDPDAGVWITDFKTAPRQVFHGWVAWIAADSQGDIIVLKGKPDLKGELWTEKWDGSALSRNAQTIPLLYNFNYLHLFATNLFDVSSDGRHIVFQSQQVLQENIGMIENLN